MCSVFLYCSATGIVDSDTVNVTDSGAPRSSSSPTQPDNGEKDLNEELGDVPDEDEVFNINIPTSDKEPTYFCEEDDEAEEALRNMSLEGHSSKATNASEKNNKKQESMDKVPSLYK